MTDSGYAVVCGSAGLGLRQTIDRIGQHLQLHFGPDDVSFAHADDFADEPVRRYVQRPRAKVIELWNRAVRHAVESLRIEARCSFIACHMTLYEPSSSVFFAPVRAASFQRSDAMPSKVILLIDDVFDMYERLSGPGEIFDERAEVTRTTDRLAEAATGGAKLDRALGNDEAQLCALDAQISTLQRLLAWRRSEMLFAENLAGQLECPMHLVGVKHPLSTIELLLDRSSHSSAYISHPISGLRRQRATLDDWPPYVDALNSIAPKLASRGVAAIMPTAIDELRFAPPAKKNLLTRTGGMTPRWPLIQSDAGLILTPGWVPRDLIDVSELLSSAPLQTSIYLRNLSAEISKEIPFRDHFIVNHCPNFLAFRPREQGRGFSGGVLREIAHFARLADAEPERRMVVVHHGEDVATIIDGFSTFDLHRRNLVLDSRRRAIDHLRDQLEHQADARNMTQYDLELLFDAGTFDDSLLGQSPVSAEQAERYRSDALEFFARTLLFAELTNLREIRDWCTILVGDASDNEVLSMSATWLSGGVLQDYDWSAASAIQDHPKVARSLYRWGEEVASELRVSDA